MAREEWEIVDRTIAAEDGYNYFACTRKGGGWKITREKEDKTEYRYAYGGYGYDWSARASQTYIRPDELHSV